MFVLILCLLCILLFNNDVLGMNIEISYVVVRSIIYSYKRPIILTSTVNIINYNNYKKVNINVTGLIETDITSYIKYLIIVFNHNAIYDTEQNGFTINLQHDVSDNVVISILNINNLGLVNLYLQ